MRRLFCLIRGLKKGRLTEPGPSNSTPTLNTISNLGMPVSVNIVNEWSFGVASTSSRFVQQSQTTDPGTLNVKPMAAATKALCELLQPPVAFSAFVHNGLANWHQCNTRQLQMLQPKWDANDGNKAQER
jgi:hypothetical protein